jgi:hypothetical protein
MIVVLMSYVMYSCREYTKPMRIKNWTRQHAICVNLIAKLDLQGKD